MKTFYCDHCGQLIYFENVQCLNCGHMLGYCHDSQKNTAFEIIGKDHWSSLAPRSLGKLYKPCFNYTQENVCNWMIPIESSDHYCLSCSLTQTIPDINTGDNRKYWYKLEQAKRRLVYSILSLKLPLRNKQEDPENGLAFEFLEGPELNQPEKTPVSIGHAKGLITINIAEANDAIRVKLRVEMKERYRTLLGHFRHEIGHYYWYLLVGTNSKWLDPCREIFGDDRQNYTEALNTYYASQSTRESHPDYISEYASSHPWEDWAETWAHYMHMYDTLETAYSWKINFNPKLSKYPKKENVIFDVDESFNEMLQNWTWATGALNSLNRSMGLNDPYPFIVTPKVSDKLRFIHKVIHES